MNLSDLIARLEQATGPDKLLDVSPLRGKNLACWCRLDTDCHADALLELANPESEDCPWGTIMQGSEYDA